MNLEKLFKTLIRVWVRVLKELRFENLDRMKGEKWS